MSLRVLLLLLCQGMAFNTMVRAQVVIPLTVFDSNQIGISVQLGSAPQPFTYLLDTGSVGFLSASGSSSAWTGAFTSTTPEDTFDISYGGGALRYQGIVAHTTLTFQTVGGGSVQVENVRMGAITEPPELYPNWDSDINNTPPIPPEHGQFFGTMGAGLDKSADNNGNFTSVLGQIPLADGLTKGFIIHTGGVGSTSATLTVGLTQELVQSFPILIAMNASTGNFTNDNGTQVKLYPQAQTTANFTISKDEHHYATTADLILDTGGLDTYLTTGSQINPPSHLLADNPSRIVDGAFFGADVAGTNNPFTNQPAQAFSWITDPTGTAAYDNLISVVVGSSVGSLNTGIPLFYEYDVLFDMENGIIGLRPVPEPTFSALLLVGSLAILAVRCKRRRSARQIRNRC